MPSISTRSGNFRTEFFHKRKPYLSNEGIIEVVFGGIENPVEFCFNVNDKLGFKLGLQCCSVSFINCSCCNESFCFEHCFTDFHFCENFIQ